MSLSYRRHFQYICFIVLGSRKVSYLPKTLPTNFRIKEVMMRTFRVAASPCRVHFVRFNLLTVSLDKKGNSIDI